MTKNSAAGQNKMRSAGSTCLCMWKLALDFFGWITLAVIRIAKRTDDQC